jgi:outer membrane protein assembly factor BamB
MDHSPSLDYRQPVPLPVSLPPRLRTGVILVILQWLLIKIPAWVAPNTMLHFMGMFWGPMLGTLAILIWWLFASRLPWKTRWTGLLAFILAAIIPFTLGDPSMRMVLVISTLPLATTIWVLWTVVAQKLGQGSFRVSLAAILFLTWGFFSLLRMEGLDGSLHAALSWRWSGTTEDKFLASRSVAIRGETPTTSESTLTLSPGDWPAFRGPLRDGRFTGTSIKTDWAQHPPKQLWKHLIGPGWSSFSVVGDRAFTQEQRGELEAVVCYQLGTGKELWAYTDHVRFNEAMAGPGPRATPTFDDGKLYAFGAKGRLNCLDPIGGKLIWSRDVAAETGAPLPNWGFSSSPLVAHGLVTVITGAPGKSIAAYNAATGEPAWSTGDGWSYCSPQLSHLAGVEQILYVTESGITGVDPTLGQVLWKHSFALTAGANRVTQPAVVGDNDIIFGAAFGVGTRRIHLAHEASTWNDQTLWTSRQFKPYYNDMVLHHGHLYGFDGSVFTCTNIDTGKPTWRASAHYGNGQVLLLPDQDLLLILSESGEVALVDAKPDAHHELARFQALEGKTWNHPVLAHGKLLVRNGQEVACFEVQ